MGFTNQEKTDMVLIYGETRGHSKLVRQIYGERFPQRILRNPRAFVNVVQHLRDFAKKFNYDRKAAFEMQSETETTV
jgi:hypothetical protein